LMEASYGVSFGEELVGFLQKLVHQFVNGVFQNTLERSPIHNSLLPYT
jgi:hypothetical protein